MDLLVHLDGKSYDLKQFAHDHPGGINTLKNYNGKSVLQAMEKFGHSSTAYHMLKDFSVKSESYENLISVSENGRIITKEEASRDVEEIAFLEELESRLDWSQPLIAQLHVIAPHYSTWMNSAVYRKCRLFANPVLESMTFTPWYTVPLVWMPIIIYLMCSEYLDRVACGDSCSSPPWSPSYFVYQLFLGIILWTLIEYSLHRWVFHLSPGNNITMIKLHFLIHGLHHKMPFDGLRQVFPPIPAVGITVILYSGLNPFLWYAPVKLVGALMGYLCYDMIHFYVHHGSPRDGTYLYAMKRYHSNHHFGNHDKAFGISSQLWDHVFKTFVKVKKLGFSLQW